MAETKGMEKRMAGADAQGNPLGILPVKSLIWKFAIPGIITQLVNSIHNIVDQVFVGWGIGDLGVAATNIVFPVTSVITALSALIGMGAAARFSIYLGKGQTKEASSILGNAVALLLLFGAAVTVGASLFLEPLLYLFGATELMMPYAQPYARIICLGILFGIFSTGCPTLSARTGIPGIPALCCCLGRCSTWCLTRSSCLCWIWALQAWPWPPFSGSFCRLSWLCTTLCGGCGRCPLPSGRWASRGRRPCPSFPWGSPSLPPISWPSSCRLCR